MLLMYDIPIHIQMLTYLISENINHNEFLPGLSTDLTLVKHKHSLQYAQMNNEHII